MFFVSVEIIPFMEPASRRRRVSARVSMPVSPILPESSRKDFKLFFIRQLLGWS